MKSFILFFLLMSFCLLDTRSFAQTVADSPKNFAVFGFDANHQSELHELETLLKANADIEMVRVDFNRNTVFIVGKENVSLNEMSLSVYCGPFTNLARCKQFGLLNIDAIDFEALLNCNAN